MFFGTMGWTSRFGIYRRKYYWSAALDRNGLRPVRYHITKDNMIILGSEAGMVRIDPSTLFDLEELRPEK